MRFDPLKFREQRELLTYTQDKLAHASNVSIRTVQRAEAGLPIRAENMADLAAALAVPVADLLLTPREEQANPSSFGQIITLRRATSGRTVVDLLDATLLARIDCDVDPTDDNLPLLKWIIGLVEAHMPDPLDHEKLGWPRRGSLVERLELIAGINRALTQLADARMGLFIGKRIEMAVMPRYGDEGFVTFRNQRPEPIAAARILISSAAADKIVIDARTQWPIEVIYDELDEDVPF